MPAAKTNAARLLDARAIAYELLAYDVDPADLSAESTAAKLGLPPEQVFKTLVVRGDRQGVCLAAIPGSARLDLKALARVSGNRKVEPVPLASVQSLTGYVRGGVTALGCKKNYPTFADETLGAWDRIAVSAGRRGLMLWLAPADYLAATDATVGAIANF